MKGVCNQMIKSFNGCSPKIDSSCFIAENAVIIGNVMIEEGASVWYGCTLRGDSDTIHIGKGSNIQDHTMIHCDQGIPTKIGEGVTIGHQAIIHACTIGSNSLIGMGSIILDGAVIGENCLIGAGSLVPPGKIIPPGHLVKGSPCQVTRPLTEDEIKGLKHSASHYVVLAEMHKNEGVKSE